MLKTKIKFINHASVVISSDDISILSDPWFQGDAFHKGWRLIHEIKDDEIDKLLDGITHIWLSHEHPDHFSVLFFKKFAAKIRQRKIIILFQDTNDKRVIKFLKKMSLNTVELPFNVDYKLSDKIKIKCIKDGFYDSGLLICNEDEKILNLNDCEITNSRRADEVLKITGTVDVLLTQFSFAAWKGGKNNVKWRREAAAEKIATMKLQIEKFQPKVVIPFASFVFFSNVLNSYLNDAVNTPRNVFLKLADTNAKIRFMKPFDCLSYDRIDSDNDAAISFWEQKYSHLSSLDFASYDIIPLKELEQSFHIYCKRIHSNNNIYFIRIIRAISPIQVFSPITVFLNDVGFGIQFDYVEKRFRTSTEAPHILLSSESLKFLFSNSFGFDTLTVNGCFEEGVPGGFATATKSLAIENLNNLGIKCTVRTLFNYSIIVLFLKRLYRVARKLES